MKVLSILKSTLCLLLIFLFPFFFLPFTQEFFATGKLYLLAFGALLLLLISTLQLLISKKLTWISLPFDTPVILFLITIVLSIVISSPNKIQALLNPNFGLVSIFSLTILYFYLSRNNLTIKQFNNLTILNISYFVLSLITIIFFFQPFKNANLPQSLQFLKNPSFTPMGSQLDLAIFLGFFVVYYVVSFLRKQESSDSGAEKPARLDTINNDLPAGSQGKTSQVNQAYGQPTGLSLQLFLIFNLVALSLTLYSLLKPYGQPSGLSLQLPPFRLSWYAAIETLKNPLTALFGVGIDNFASIFTQIKDFAYNQSTFWQINSFAVSRSTILHIFSETGLFGLLAFGLLIASLLRETTRNGTQNNANKFFIFYLLFIVLFFPPSLPVFFLFFITLTFIANSNQFQPASPKLQRGEPISTNSNEFDLSNLMPVYLGIVIISLVFIAGTGYLLGRAYASEIYFKKGLDGFAKNDAKQVYDNMRQAIILNPYIERFRINFSQTNLLIANNIASKKQEEITDQDRQNISQGIQAAIAEAKAAASLNPQKAGSWENLAGIYRNILNVAQGADVWTISAYQRAIVSDPQNPIYRLNLGGVYYSLGNYEEAVKLFEQSVGLKPDWSNAHYNLAWALYQRKDYQRAASEMQNVSSLIDPKSEDFKKVQKDLEEFKKMLPKEEATAAGELKPGQLSLPTPPTATVEPKIQLPKEASPEAKY
jgi:tetratricopeptide (TPR) repeat protein